MTQLVDLANERLKFDGLEARVEFVAGPENAEHDKLLETSNIPVEGGLLVYGGKEFDVTLEGETEDGPAYCHLAKVLKQKIQYRNLGARSFHEMLSNMMPNSQLLVELQPDATLSVVGVRSAVPLEGIRSDYLIHALLNLATSEAALSDLFRKWINEKQ